MMKWMDGPKTEISLDDVGSVNLLVESGQRFARSIDWEGILSGTTEQFRINPNNTDPAQYKA
jgi:hypothetical protein